MTRATVMKFLPLASVALLAALFAGCGSSPSMPTPASVQTPTPEVSLPTLPLAPPIDGVWEGEFRVIDCAGERHCGDAIGQLEPYTLRLRQAGPSVEGIFQSRSTVIDVKGTIAPNGVLFVSGSSPSPTHQGSIGTQMNQLKAQVDPIGGLAGLLDFEIYYDNEYYGSGRISYRGAIVSGHQSPFDAAFTGPWRGEYVVRSCKFVGWQDCYPVELNELAPFELRLTQSGSSVSGHLFLRSTEIPVSGSINADQLTLAGGWIFPDGRIVRLTGCDVRRDEFGRLTGHFSYFDEYNVGPPHVTTYEAELWNVLPLP